MEQTLGKRIVSHRKQLGMTQDKLAEKLGVTAQAVSKWENDQACPDIAMLPKLAEIFATTTDELLGIPPQPAVHQAQIVDEAEEAEENSDEENGWEFHYDAGRKGSITLAVFVLLVGGLLLASTLLDWGVGFGEILWPSALLVFGLSGLYPRFSFFQLGCTLFGGYFLLNNLHILHFSFGWELLLPIGLLLFGASLMADALRKSKKPRVRVTHHGKPWNHPEEKFSSTLNLGESSFQCSTKFGDDHRLISLPRLSGGSASLSFGDLTVDLSGCQEICEGCHIEAHCSFGEIIFLVPRKWRVEPASSAAFASVEVGGQPAADPEAVITMDCSVSFGSIEICYV